MRIQHCIYVNSWMQFFLKKHVKYLVRLKQCPIFASHTSTHNIHYHDTARFFSYFRAVFFWDNTNNSYICAILFILSNSFMFFRLGFPFYPSGFLLRKSPKNDPYVNDYFCFNKKNTSRNLYKISREVVFFAQNCQKLANIFHIFA